MVLRPPAEGTEKGLGPFGLGLPEGSPDLERMDLACCGPRDSADGIGRGLCTGGTEPGLLLKHEGKTVCGRGPLCICFGDRPGGLVVSIVRHVL